MESGKLRNKISIQEATEVDGSMGSSQSLTWANVEDTWWANIRHLSSREMVNAQGVAADATHQITMRYYSSLTPKHRILYGSRVFNISSINNINERNRTMVVIVSEDV